MSSKPLFQIFFKMSKTKKSNNYKFSNENDDSLYSKKPKKSLRDKRIREIDRALKSRDFKRVLEYNDKF